MDLAPGLAALIDHVVVESDTSAAMGTSDVPVLSTPRIILLAEQATASALAGRLPEGVSAVEHRVEISHLAPTAVGAKVTAEAILEAVDGRRLTFRVSVTDSRGLIAAGRFTRVLVSRENFLQRAAEAGDE
ncbi:MAG TPA: hotdog domain-containing protein [Acidimicrobiia bacterium]|nr:hotdog domain-containing protein [Acidimicrobiia bacterium]